MIIAATDRSTYLDVSKIEWEPTKFPGVYMKRLYEDPSGKLTTLTKMDPGAVLPDHRHVGLEQSFVIEGALVDEDGDVHGGQLRLAARRLGTPRLVAGWLRRAGDLRHAERVPVDPAQRPSASRI